MATFDINDVARRVQYTSTGQTGPFNFTFQVNASSELLVYIDDTVKTETTHYTVSLNADGTGSVTFTTATTSGELITIIGDQPLSRTTVFQVGQVNQPTTLETEFDNTLIRQQQIKEITDRSIQLKPSTGRTVTGSGTSGPLYFPYDSTVANNASKVIAYDSAGTSLELGPTTTNLNTLAGIASDISTVAGISSDVTSVAGNASNINTVSGISANVTTVAGDSTNIGTVAGISSNITTVAGISANVTTVAGISSNVTTVAGISSDVTTVAADGTDIGTVATNIASVNTTAANITGVNSFADRYRVGSSDPVTSLDAGDLFFNTTSNSLKYYDSGSWNVIASTFSIDSASDTNLTSVADGAMLLYDTGTSKWIDNVMSGDATMADTGAVTIANNAITTAKINADAVDGTKIADDSIDSEHYVDGSIDTAHIADSQITNAKMADDSVGSAELIDNSVGASALNVSGNGTSGQVLASDGDGTFSWADSASPFAYNAVTGTTPSLDVGTYNFFDNGTLSGNTTVSFSNVPTEANWRYTFKGAVGNSYDVANAVYQSKNFNSSSTTTNDTYGMSIGDSGTKLYINTYGSGTGANGKIHQFALSTPYDISTASLVTSVVAAQSYGFNMGLDFKTDGTKCYVIQFAGTGAGDSSVEEYSLSTAWDISTLSHTTTYDMSAQMAYQGARDIHFKNDGTSFYVLNRVSPSEFYQYNCSTAWDISTASYSGNSFTTSPAGINAMVLNGDGTKFFAIDNLNYLIRIHSMSTAYDLSTASLDTPNFDVSSQTTGGYYLEVDDTGNHLYVQDSTAGTIYQYSIGSAASVTLPASVQNTPQETVGTSGQHTYEFYTADGGTNVYLINEDKI